MEFGSERYYKSSGAAPAGGVLLAFVISVAAAAALAFVYSFINWYNPIIYITFLATCGLSFGVGMAVIFSLTVGKVRNSTLGTIVGLTAGLAALYFAWVFFLWEASEYTRFFFNPSELFFRIRLLGELGLWDIKGSTPTGWGLYTFWLLEAGIVVLGPTLLGWIYDSPFCERCNSWADENECGANLQVPHNLEELKRDLEDEQYSSLHDLIQGGANPDNCLKIKVFMCPECDDSNWLTVEQHVTTENAKGESSTSTTEVVKHLAIPRDLAEELVAAIPDAGGGMEALLTDIPQSKREEPPQSIPLAGDDKFEDSDDDDEDFWDTNKT